jgi:hypothetical protein
MDDMGEGADQYITNQIGRRETIGRIEEMLVENKEEDINQLVSERPKDRELIMSTVREVRRKLRGSRGSQAKIS